LNSLENVERNNCKNITVIEGDASVLKNKYDIIIANINRNILMQEMATYISCLNKNGTLFLSGFYADDIPMIQKEGEKHLLKFEEKLERNNWVSLKFIN
ncbi:50S ribosomal protein L11 methyltransferase, partial [Algibacter sp.]|uniref:50S ribosomal protein L11 methyltransferase n=1 Tax=Algibacter sp. TaxID=1872428 RepID=UPI003C73C315